MHCTLFIPNVPPEASPVVHWIPFCSYTYIANELLPSVAKIHWNVLPYVTVLTLHEVTFNYHFTNLVIMVSVITYVIPSCYNQIQWSAYTTITKLPFCSLKGLFITRHSKPNSSPECCIHIGPKWCNQLSCSGI